VEAGAVIPTRSPGTRQFGSAQEVPESLELVVYPGLRPGAVRNSTYYDDDGITNAYTAGAYALTTVQHKVPPIISFPGGLWLTHTHTNGGVMLCTGDQQQVGGAHHLPVRG
jgi:alpha-glucosidase (family GH31 glycosyl hydrolase)